MSTYPNVKDPNMVGEYDAEVKSGGGYVWDDVLEYRVWCHPHEGAPDVDNGSDYYYPFVTFEEAFEFSKNNEGCEDPIALILQEEFIDEPEPGKYIHVKERRITEWSLEFLKRPRRTDKTIPDFLSPDAPPNKLDILRGNV
jgi:hypothetical protein